ncbi:hypothetical protein U3516DRAFT_861887 [Neocallimastix sp. 'constans']
MKYNEDIFSNGTFYIASKFSYQVELDVKDLNYFNLKAKFLNAMLRNASLPYLIYIKVISNVNLFVNPEYIIVIFLVKLENITNNGLEYLFNNYLNNLGVGHFDKWNIGEMSSILENHHEKECDATLSMTKQKFDEISDESKKNIINQLKK